MNSCEVAEAGASKQLKRISDEQAPDLQKDVPVRENPAARALEGADAGTGSEIRKIYNMQEL